MPPAITAPSAGTGPKHVPKSSHTADPLLAPFLGPTFNPTAYLNSALPSLAIPTATQPIIPAKALTLSDLATRTQSHLTQLSALCARLTTTLTALTDDILRGGSRLAYSVELLRGEASALTEAVTETLATHISELVPGGLSIPEKKELAEQHATLANDLARGPTVADETPSTDGPIEPEAVRRLRTLLHVRKRLQSVLALFDLALSWPLPPSSLSLTTSIVSVSGPSGPVGRSQGSWQSQEEKGQAAQATLRESVMNCLGNGGPDGVLRAEERVEQLRDLVEVWKGTSEERPRLKFVDGLAKIVADKRKEEEGKGTLKKKEESSGSNDNTQEGRAGGKGLLGNLRRLREEIYLE